jgi:predicted MFS family arabinose efflux permease
MSAADTAATAGASGAQGGAGAPTFSKGYRAWLLFVLLLVNALNLADRQGIAATAPAFRQELHLTGAQVGWIQGGGFALFYTLFGLPMALLAERRNRTRLISASLAVFGVMVAACGTIHNFWQMMLFRIGVGIGDAGFGPPVASVIGDHYPATKRASAMTVIWLGAPIGAVTGAVAAGWIAQNYGWRIWYFALGAPSILVALLAFLTLREPTRGMSDPVAIQGKPPSIFTTFRFLLAKRSVWFILIGGGLAATAMNALGQFFATYLVGSFHIGLAEAGRLLGLMAGGSMASGLALGGFGVDWAGMSERRWYVWAPAIGLALASPLFFFGAAQASLVSAIAVLFLGHVALFVYYTPTLALAQNMVGANMRASSAFVTSLVLGLVGIGLGPPLVGVLDDYFTQKAFPLGNFIAMCPGGSAPAGASTALANACVAANGDGIRHAIMAMSLLFVAAGVFYFLASFNLRKDLDTHYEAKQA